MQVFLRDGVNEVRSTANLERAAALKILAFEERLNSCALVEAARCQHRRSAHNGIDPPGGFFNTRKSDAHCAPCHLVLLERSRTSESIVAYALVRAAPTLVSSLREPLWCSIVQRDAGLRNINRLLCLGCMKLSDIAHCAFSKTTMVSIGSRSVFGKRSSVPPSVSRTSTGLPSASSVALRILGSLGSASTSSLQSST